MTSSLLLAAATNDSGLGGWWVGVGIGVVVVLVVAAVVVTIIALARRITRQAVMAIGALDAAEANTRALWDVGTTNGTALAVLEGAIRAREALEDA